MPDQLFPKVYAKAVWRVCSQFQAMGRLLLAVVLLSGCAGQPREPAQQAPELDLQQARIHAQQGLGAYDQGDVTAAIEAWSRAVELNPADAVTVNNLALLLKQKHRFQEAVTLLERGLEVSPAVADLHYNLAVISELYLLDLQRALTHYQRYQALSAAEDKKVTGWIADLERRLD